MCPHCQTSTHLIKRGIYRRPSDQKKIQRFHCKKCNKGHSTQTHSFDYRQRKRHINQTVFRLFSKGSSERAIAEIIGVNKKTIARRVSPFAKCARKNLERMREETCNVCEIVFDEMESFEHTKLKPLTIPLAVEKHTRKILAFDVGVIAAKGTLAHISVKKYGKRKCQRRKVLESLFKQIEHVAHPKCCFSSDESTHYPGVLRRHFKDAEHLQFKGRAAAVVGQGEMKKGGFDPLFSLNQTAAMIRDNIKRMARRTWCTTKRIDRLLDFLAIYAIYHNQIIEGVRRPRIFNMV